MIFTFPLVLIWFKRDAILMMWRTLKLNMLLLQKKRSRNMLLSVYMQSVLVIADSDSADMVMCIIQKCNLFYHACSLITPIHSKTNLCHRESMQSPQMETVLFSYCLLYRHVKSPHHADNVPHVFAASSLKATWWCISSIHHAVKKNCNGNPCKQHWCSSLSQFEEKN